ncbi:hypothetical protein V6N13_146470 [Hibiscus sabdariffa]
MPKRQISNSESEESESEEKFSEDEDEDEDDDEVILKQEQQGISEYEKQRLSRIAENRARMEALGLSKIASSLMGSSPNSSRPSSKLKGKRKVVDDDEDYRPNDDEDDKDDDDNDDDNEEFPGSKTPQSESRKNKVKNKGSKPKKKAPVRKQLNSSDYVDNDDELMKAIALSLKDSGEDSGAVPADAQDATFTERKGNNARNKRKKSFTSRTQMTEDEMVVHFFQFDDLKIHLRKQILWWRVASHLRCYKLFNVFPLICFAVENSSSNRGGYVLSQENLLVNITMAPQKKLVLKALNEKLNAEHLICILEAGKGGISMRDLRRVAIAHDFMWTDKELGDMIHCFDGDRDGKLNLDDFRKVVSRCNMLRTSENS